LIASWFFHDDAPLYFNEIPQNKMNSGESTVEIEDQQAELE